MNCPPFVRCDSAVATTDGDTVFTVKPWVAEGKDPRELANSFLIEYCNNIDIFGYTGGVPQPSGTLSQIDSQVLSLTFHCLSLLDLFLTFHCLTTAFHSLSLTIQALLTYDNLTTVGAYNDNDMLTICNGRQSEAEYRSQFSTVSY